MNFGKKIISLMCLCCAVNLVAAPAAPGSFDVRNMISINPIKDQGQTGPVVAYATVDAMEISLAYQKNVKSMLSEAFLYTCDATDFNPGCSGADMPTNFLTNTGFAADNQFPIGTPQTSCAGTPIFAKAVATGSAGTTTDEIKQSILKYGSVIATVDAGAGDFTSYAGGIFNDCTTGDVNPNHVITLIGWNDAGQYWIARNSWGTNWGDKGYIQIKYGCNGVGQETFFVDSGR